MLLDQQRDADVHFTFSEEEDLSSRGSQDDNVDGVEDTRGVQEVLEDLFQQQQRAEMLWQQALEKGDHSSIGAHVTTLLPVQLDGFSASKCKQEVLEDRVPLWNYLETKDLIGVRGEMERDNEVCSTHKNLWDPISARMRDKGYARSAEQCKRKWKKLVNRYREKRASGLGSGRKLVFFDELDTIFKARSTANKTVALVQKQQELKNDPAESSAQPTPLASDKLEVMNGHLSDEADSDYQRKRRKTSEGVHQLLVDFIAGQEKVEKQWQEQLTKRQQAWRRMDEEWMRRMERLEKQRLDWEVSWRERQEESRAREEAREQRWDQLLALLVRNVRGC